MIVFRLLAFPVIVTSKSFVAIFVRCFTQSAREISHTPAGEFLLVVVVLNFHLLVTIILLVGGRPTNTAMLTSQRTKMFTARAGVTIGTYTLQKSSLSCFRITTGTSMETLCVAVAGLT
jgi:hypothetical protein